MFTVSHISSDILAFEENFSCVDVDMLQNSTVLMVLIAFKPNYFQFFIPVMKQVSLVRYSAEPCRSGSKNQYMRSVVPTH